MNRYPDQVGGGGALLSARGNGFLRSKWFRVPGSFTFQLPPDLPTINGLVRVMGFCIGGGGHGDSANGGNGNFGGTGGGFSQREVYVTPEEIFTVVVGQGGQSRLAPAGDNSSITIDGKAWSAAGGGISLGGQGAGGDINTKGGNLTINGSNSTPVSGSSSGSPWGDGAMGAAGNSAAGAKWRVPTFWDLSEISDAAGFVDFVGLGAGGQAAAAVGGGGALGTPPSAGGGGAGGYDSAYHKGADGIAVIYY